MFTFPEIEAIQAEKRILQQQSDLNRHLLGMEWIQFKNRVTSYRPRLPSTIPLGSLALLAAPVAGYLLIRRLRFTRGLWLKGLVLWQLTQRVRGILAFLRRFR